MLWGAKCLNPMLNVLSNEDNCIVDASLVNKIKTFCGFFTYIQVIFNTFYDLIIKLCLIFV